MDNETTTSTETNQPSGGSFQAVIDKVVVLTGPTASGKSAVAIELAERIDAEILSLDSIAVYREMDIGTAKPDRSARRRVPHHLIDLVDPVEDFSVARYLRAAHQAIDGVLARGRRVVFVGGTPMFLKGILRGFDPGPPADWSFRQAVESDVANHGVEALRKRLLQVDPLAAHRIGPNDTRRMIRALEVYHHTGIPLSHRQVQFDQSRDAESCHVYSLAWPRDQLHQRVNSRVQQMFAAGLVDEVRQLLERFGELSRTASQAVGYREVIEYLGGVHGWDATVQLVSAHTRQLARRQETWLRSFPEIRSIPVAEPLPPEIVAAEISQRILAAEKP
jgi:tRNA dimethylallyltransferase